MRAIVLIDDPTVIQRILARLGHRALRKLPGVARVHIMAHRQEHLAREIIAESGIIKERESADGAVQLGVA